MTLSRPLMTTPRIRLVVWALFLAGFGSIHGVVRAQSRSAAAVPKTALLANVRAEDERRWDGVLEGLLSHSNPAVRSRAVLAAGRIGNELAMPALVSLLQSEKDRRVRSLAAFALGEIESPKAVEALASELAKGDAPRARIVEALGKIAAALPQTNEVQKKEIGKTILGVLTFEARRRSRPDSEVILLALTATLRARPEGAGAVVAEFLSYSDPRIRSDAGNTLARLRAADGNAELRKLLTSDSDPNVRANAARVLGATEDKAAFEGLVDRELNDPDSRVRVSAIRAVASLRDPRSIEPLVERGKQLLAGRRGPFLREVPISEISELLEVATTLGRVAQNTGSSAVIDLLKASRVVASHRSPELEIAMARVAPQRYLDDPQMNPAVNALLPDNDWRAWTAMAQGFAELANVRTDNALQDARVKNEGIRILSDQISYQPQSNTLSSSKIKPDSSGVLGKRDIPVPPLALADFLRAYAAFKPKDLEDVLRQHLQSSDVVVRATAAELIGELALNIKNIESLGAALTVALRDKASNDASLAILDALAKQKNRNANEAIKTVLDSSDYLVRRKAIEALKASGAGDFSNRLGEVETRNTARDYERAISRIGKRVLAVVTTNKGRFTIELLPEAAPLNVDNFVQLARRGYFNRIVFHRVVPNFVIQGGDPRGDGNGGPGYQVRCEINEVPYRRGAVGMALSGKDTGGSQWFVTHAPQPHLDGGYTVFGNVVSGMEVVDRIARGDMINSIVVTEKPAPKTKTAPVNILEN
jgi:cyclophilin family peptidyl-prolyl cis-trans isomerase/HEAT repeat protein